MCVTAYGVPNPGPEDKAQIAINIYDIVYFASIGLITVFKTVWHDGSAILSQHAMHAHTKDFKHKTTSSACN